MPNPKVSIITPALNAEKYIKDCILSVANQTYKDIEHVIVDGSSTDGTLDIVKKCAEEYSYIRWVSQENRGIYGNMNRGIDIAQGEWLYFLGADDILADNKALERIFIDHKDIVDNSDFVYGNVIWGDTGETYAGSFNIDKFYKQNICHQAIFVRKAVFDKIGKFLTEYRTLADWHFNILCFTDPEIRKSYVDTVVAKYSLGGISSTLAKKLWAKEMRCITNTLIINVGLTEHLKCKLKLIKKATIFQKIKLVLYMAMYSLAYCFAHIKQRYERIKSHIKGR